MPKLIKSEEYYASRKSLGGDENKEVGGTKFNFLCFKGQYSALNRFQKSFGTEIRKLEGGGKVMN